MRLSATSSLKNETNRLTKWIAWPSDGPGLHRNAGIALEAIGFDARAGQGSRAGTGNASPPGLEGDSALYHTAAGDLRRAGRRKRTFKGRASAACSNEQTSHGDVGRTKTISFRLDRRMCRDRKTGVPPEPGVCRPVAEVAAELCGTEQSDQCRRRYLCATGVWRQRKRMHAQFGSETMSNLTGAM